MSNQKIMSTIFVDKKIEKCQIFVNIFVIIKIDLIFEVLEMSLD